MIQQTELENDIMECKTFIITLTKEREKQRKLLQHLLSIQKLRQETIMTIEGTQRE